MLVTPMLKSYYPGDLPQLVDNEENQIEPTNLKGTLGASLTYTLSIFSRDLKDISIGWFTILLILVFASVNWIIL